MNFNNFTIKSQEAVQRAQQIATQNNNQAIENAHLLKAILGVDENAAPYLLKKLNINILNLEKALDRMIASYQKLREGSNISQGRSQKH